MLPHLPFYIPLLFSAIVILSVAWIHFACQSKIVLYVIVVWTMFQSVLSLKGIYQDTAAMPPLIVRYGIFPILLLLVGFLFTKKGKALATHADLKALTWFHTIRVPVEFVLVLLYYHGLIPVHMTFEGTNFDIISGFTAGIVGFFVFRRNTIKKPLLLIWNALCLLLLINIVITSALAAPSPFQQLAFEQPNRAIFYFPFSLLPTVVVPLVLFAHLIGFMQLLNTQKD